MCILDRYLLMAIRLQRSKGISCCRTNAFLRSTEASLRSRQLSYEYESWSLTKSNGKLRFEKKLSCAIFGRKEENEVFQRRYYFEMWREFAEQNIIILTEPLQQCPDNRCGARQPKARWIDGIQVNLCTLGSLKSQSQKAFHYIHLKCFHYAPLESE